MYKIILDKVEGTKILTELDESKNKLVHFLNSVERHQNKCQSLVELLKSSKSALNLQLRDVTIVDDVIDVFINFLKKNLFFIRFFLFKPIIPIFRYINIF